MALRHHKGVFPALGLHPWAAAEDLDVSQLQSQIQSCSAVAIGEIGLDTKIEEPSLQRQLEVFEEQVDLAARLELPVILHCRGAFDELLSVIQNQSSPVNGIMHAYSRGPELAFRILDSGLFLGMGGAATRPRARRLKRTLRAVPLDRLVLETDAPAIGLDGVKPEDTEPRHVAQVAQAIAEVRSIELLDVATTTTANAESLFPGLRVV